jgi:hypothetical protein
LQSKDDRKQREADRLAAAQALWEDLAVRARGLHCPEHFVQPWRVVVIGETAERLRLNIYGCCPKLQVVVSEMIRSDPRTSGPA